MHASAGAGHRRAAEAVAKAFVAEEPRTDIVLSDILDFTPAVFRETYAKGYLRLVRNAPELWGYMYDRLDRKAQVPWRAKVRTTFNKINVAKFVQFYKRFRPDAVVCTHFLPLDVISNRILRGRSDAALYCAVTDFAVHSLWLAEAVDCYYVSTGEARRHLLRQGQAEDRVVVSGIPVDPVFAQSVEPIEARRLLGLDPLRPAVLVLSGGYGVGAAPQIVAAFGEQDAGCQLLVVAGANRSLQEEASAAAEQAKVPVKVYGQVDNVHELMDAADLLISKSGGLTTSEALAKGKPMLITDPIPGQEQRNCEHLLENGAAVRLYETADAPYKVRSLLTDRVRLDRMRACARDLGRPQAARDLVLDVMKRQATSVTTPE